MLCLFQMNNPNPPPAGGPGAVVPPANPAAGGGAGGNPGVQNAPAPAAVVAAPNMVRIASKDPEFVSQPQEELNNSRAVQLAIKLDRIKGERI